MLFADDIIFIDKTRGRVNSRLKVWSQTLESKEFKLSKTKTEYLECKFSNVIHEVGMKVGFNAQVIPKRGCSK